MARRERRDSGSSTISTAMSLGSQSMASGYSTRKYELLGTRSSRLYHSMPKDGYMFVGGIPTSRPYASRDYPERPARFVYDGPYEGSVSKQKVYEKLELSHHR